MSLLYVCSDLHLGHINLALNLRGFHTVGDHDQYIIDSWNAIIKKRDVVWILGDITMETKKHYHLLSKLNGMKNVVLGNHDLPKDIHYLQKYVNKICGVYEYKNLILTHMPVDISVMAHNKWLKNIHGHDHHNEYISDRHFNVTMEAIRFTPVLISKFL